MILPAIWAVREPPLPLQNTCSNFENYLNLLLMSCCVSFNGCCAFLTSPFLPIIESAGLSLLVTFPERTENYLHPFRKFLTNQKEVAGRAENIVNRIYPGPPVVIIYFMEAFLFLRNRPKLPRPSRTTVVGSGT